LQAAFFASVEAPGNLELADVGAIDLSEGGVAIVFIAAAVARPVLRRAVGLNGRGLRQEQGGER